MFRDVAPARYLNEGGDASDIAGVPVGGDLTGTLPNPSLIPLHAGGGPVGDSGNVPVITWDSKGRVVSVTAAPITTTGNGFKTFMQRRATGPAGKIPYDTNLQSDTVTNVGFVTVTPTVVTIPVTGLLHYSCQVIIQVGANNDQQKQLTFYKVSEGPYGPSAQSTNFFKRLEDNSITFRMTHVLQVTVGDQFSLLFEDRDSIDPQAVLNTSSPLPTEYWTIF